MKTAIYLEDGETQLVLTPENDFEARALAELLESGDKMSFVRGEFYACRGGYTRHREHMPSTFVNAASYFFRVEKQEGNETP